MKADAKSFAWMRLLVLAIAAAALLVLAGPALAQGSAGPDKSWGAFFGRTHVLFLHLPIGLLIGAFAVEVIGVFRRSRGYDIAAAWLFVFGAIASVFAVFSGMLLGVEEAGKSAKAGEAPESILQLLTADSIEQGVSETLGWHMWLGITLMLAAIVAAVLKIIAVRRQWKDTDSAIPHTGGWPLLVARVSIIGSMALLPFAGHLGGNMTHGNEFLTEVAPFQDSIPEWAIAWPEVVEEGTGTVVVKGDDGAQIELVNGTAAFWNAKIQPVMDKHCTDCHNASKQNGGLRLDTLEWAMKGGSAAGTDNIIADDIYLESEMYRRVSLPHWHEEHMPTNKKKYGTMTTEQVDMLARWLMEFDGKLDSGKAVEGTARKPREEPKPEPAEPAIDPKAIDAITTAGGNAKSLSLAQPELTVKFAYLKDLSPDNVATLAKAADQVAWLTFEGSSLDDAALGELPDLPILTELNLKDTKVTDAGINALPGLPKLAWLNLFGTGITDASVDSLSKLDTLDKLYVTGTKISEDGVGKLRAALPDTQVFSDYDGLFTFPADTPEPVKPDSEKTAEETAEAGAPVNDKCPVTGAAINAEQFVIYKDKKVGFCCGNCKAKFEKDPEQFAGKLEQ